MWVPLSRHLGLGDFISTCSGFEDVQRQRLHSGSIGGRVEAGSSALHLRRRYLGAKVRRSLFCDLLEKEWLVGQVEEEVEAEAPGMISRGRGGSELVESPRI
jgi:hypothetical protein